MANDDVGVVVGHDGVLVDDLAVVDLQGHRGSDAVTGSSALFYTSASKCDFCCPLTEMEETSWMSNIMRNQGAPS